MKPDIVEHLFQELSSQRTGIRFILHGPAGSGKATLVNDFCIRPDKDHYGIYRTRFYDLACSSESGFRDLLLSLLEASDEDEPASLVTRCNELVATNSNKPELYNAACYHLLGRTIPKGLSSLYAALTHSKRLHITAQLLCKLIIHRLSEKPVILVLEELQHASNEQCKILKEILQSCEQHPLFILTSATEISTHLSHVLTNAAAITLETNKHAGIPQPSFAGLADKDQHALNVAAILGVRFSPEVLSTLIDDPHYDATPLIEAGFLNFQRHTLQFVHELVKQRIYTTLSEEFLQKMHRAAAAYYLFGNTVMYAHHLIAMNDPGAANACLTAALSLRDEYKLDQACIFFDKCILLAANESDRFLAASLKADTLLDVHEYSLAVQAYDAAQRQTQNEQDQAQSWLGMAIALLHRKHNNTAKQLLQRAQKTLLKSHDHNLLTRFYYYQALSAEQANEIENAITANKIAFEHARDAQNTYWQAQVALSMGRLDTMRLNAELARSSLLLALNLARDNGYRLIELSCLISLARICLYQLELRDALAHLNTAIHLANMLDDKEIMLEAQILLSLHDLLKGQYANMLQHTALAKHLCKLLHHTHHEGYVHCMGELSGYFTQQPISLHDQSEHASSLWPATQALISTDRETALLYLINSQLTLRNLPNLEALELCLFAIEACIKHELWEMGEDLADHIIMRMHADPLPLFVMCAERIRLLSNIAHAKANTTTRVELFDMLTRSKRYGLQFHLPAYEQALSRKQHVAETI